MQLHNELHPPSGSESNEGTDIRYELFKDFGSGFPDFSSLNKPDNHGTVSTVSSGVPETPSQLYGVEYKGNIQVTRKGYYTFYIKTNQEAKVYVDDKLVASVKDDTRNFGRYGIIGLMQGEHDFRIEYVNKDGKNDNPKVQWSGPNTARREL